MARPVGSGLIAEEIKDICKRTGTAFIHFCIMATLTAHGGEALVLHVEKFRQPTARHRNLVGVIARAAALRAFPISAHTVFSNVLALQAVSIQFTNKTK